MKGSTEPLLLHSSDLPQDPLYLLQVGKSPLGPDDQSTPASKTPTASEDFWLLTKWLRNDPFGNPISHQCLLDSFHVMEID